MKLSRWQHTVSTGMPRTSPATRQFAGTRKAITQQYVAPNNINAILRNSAAQRKVWSDVGAAAATLGDIGVRIKVAEDTQVAQSLALTMEEGVNKIVADELVNSTSAVTAPAISQQDTSGKFIGGPLNESGEPAAPGEQPFDFGGYQDYDATSERINSRVQQFLTRFEEANPKLKRGGVSKRYNAEKNRVLAKSREELDAYVRDGKIEVAKASYEDSLGRAKTMDALRGVVASGLANNLTTPTQAQTDLKRGVERINEDGMNNRLIALSQLAHTNSVGYEAMVVDVLSQLADPTFEISDDYRNQVLKEVNTSDRYYHDHLSKINSEVTYARRLKQLNNPETRAAAQAWLKSAGAADALGSHYGAFLLTAQRYETGEAASNWEAGDIRKEISLVRRNQSDLTPAELEEWIERADLDDTTRPQLRTQALAAVETSQSKAARAVSKKDRRMFTPPAAEGAEVKRRYEMEMEEYQAERDDFADANPDLTTEDAFMSFDFARLTEWHGLISVNGGFYDYDENSQPVRVKKLEDVDWGATAQYYQDTYNAYQYGNFQQGIQADPVKAAEIAQTRRLVDRVRALTEHYRLEKWVH